jgi:PAS domain S-box-containing protein
LGKHLKRHANAQSQPKINNLKPAETVISKRDELYEAIVESQVELICRFLSNGQLTFVNHAFCRYFGRKSNELIGKSFMQFIPPEDRPGLKKHLTSLNSKSSSKTIDRRVIKQTGDIIWQQWIDRAIFDARGRIKEYQSVGRDMSEKALAEQEVKESERYLGNIFDAIQDGIIVLDKNLNILWVNSAVKKLYPDSGPFKDKKCYQVYYGRKKPCKNCPTIRAIESGRLEMEIVPWPRSQKTMGWLELSSFPLLSSTGKLNGVVECIRDVTERVTAEDALSESEQRFRIFADFTYDWEYWVAPDGTFEYVSPSCERVTGYSADDFSRDPKLLEKIVYSDDRTLVAKHLKKDLVSKVSKPLEFRIVTRDGEIRWISHNCQSVFDSRKNFLGRRVSNRDITNQKHAEIKQQKEYHDVVNQVQEYTAQLKRSSDELISRQQELLEHKSKLEEVNTELLETNRAISVLARNIDKNRQEIEQTIAKAINTQIMPIIEDLRTTKNLGDAQVHLDMLAANLQALTSDLTGGINMLAALTPAEMRVATMIKNGLTSQQIADRLFISLHTAKTHRRNIRKKLKVTNSRINLTSYLKFLT